MDTYGKGKRIDRDFSASFARLLARDRDLLSDPRYPLLHDPECPARDGSGPCACDRVLVAFRKRLLEIFLRIALPEDDRADPPEALKERHGGRPTKYDRVLAIQIGLSHVVGKMSQGEALSACGISRSSLKRWRRRYPWFDAMLRVIRKGRTVFPRIFPRKVLDRPARAEGGTPIAVARTAPIAGYKCEYARYARPSIRQTVKAIGVSPTTVHRWAHAHFLEFGAKIAIAGCEERVATLFRRASGVREGTGR